MVAIMDRRFRRLPDPVTANGERRRSVRQKLHTPVYASFNGPQTGLVVDLSELLDLHEDGFAVQTSAPLEVNRAVTVCLDLPETKSFIHGTGRVVWSDDSGRGGIQLSELPESSRRILKEWLFANLLIACSNRAARAEQLARREQELRQSMVAAQSPGGGGNVIPINQASDDRAALDALRLEVRNLGDHVDAVLQLITRQAIHLTRASGAALALLTDAKMICRAEAGMPAPPIGTPVDVTQGLSGECVRNGIVVSCEDMENDPRVDPDLGRTLGIGSLIAAPIFFDSGVVGLLEVFSPRPRNFTKSDENVLAMLAEMVPHREPTPRALFDFNSAEPAATYSEKTFAEIAPFEDLPAKIESPALVPDLAVEHVATAVSASQPGLIDVVSIKVSDDALWEHQPEVSDPDISQQSLQPLADALSDPSVAEETATKSPEEFAPSADIVPSRLPATLLGLAVLVVFLAVGYLVGPIVERRFASSLHAVQGSSANQSDSQRSSAKDNSPSQPSDSSHLPVKSLTELQALADRGDPDAQWQMGVRYHSGDGVAQNDKQAMLWFQLAAEQGNVSAQSALGSYYWAGRGVPEDLSKAYMWSAIALAHGDEISKSRLEGLASRMTRQQVSAATDQADAWLRAHTQRAKSEAN